MVVVVYRVIVKEKKEEDFKKIALTCTESALKSTDCIKYTFFQALDNPREFLVYYRFKDLDAQKNHIENLRKVLGPSPEGRDLPRKFIELLEDEELVLFNPNV
jgi:quinol monooxygenase YgiN